MSRLDKFANRVDGETKLLGLIGENLHYTRSPRLHNAAANLLQINAIYLPLPLPAVALANFLEAMWQLGAMGFNVTQPHKNSVASLFPAAGLTTVNTLYRGDAGWQTASTDGPGFARGLQRLGKTLTDFQNLVVLGTGGAAEAIIVEALKSTSAGRTIKILRRSKARDAALRAAIPAEAAVGFYDLTVETLAKMLNGKDETTLLVQATSAPLHGEDLSGLMPALRGFRGVVADLVYGKPSALYFAAIAQDLIAQDGEAMLIEQARLSQMLWWGKAATYEDMAAALREK